MDCGLDFDLEAFNYIYNSLDGRVIPLILQPTIKPIA